MPMPYFPESALAHHYIDPLQPGPGLEIGSAWHNDFGIPNTLNLDHADYHDNLRENYSGNDPIWQWYEQHTGGRLKPVDIVADATEIPAADSSYRWLIHCHVFEHLTNPIKALLEWHRVLKPGAILFSVVCKRDALPCDAVQPITPLAHYIEDYEAGATSATHPVIPGHGQFGHAHIFTLSSYFGLLAYLDPDEQMFQLLHVLRDDDKVGNGFTTVHRVIKAP